MLVPRRWRRRLGAVTVVLLVLAGTTTIATMATADPAAAWCRPGIPGCGGDDDDGGGGPPPPPPPPPTTAPPTTRPPQPTCEYDENAYTMRKQPDRNPILEWVFGSLDEVDVARMTPHVEWCHLPGGVTSARRFRPTDMQGLFGGVKITPTNGDGEAAVKPNSFIGQFSVTANVEVVHSLSGTAGASLGWAIGYACTMTVSRDYYPSPYNPRILFKDTNSCDGADVRPDRKQPAVIAPIRQSLPQDEATLRIGEPRIAWVIVTEPTPQDGDGELRLVDANDPDCADPLGDDCKTFTLDLPPDGDDPGLTDDLEDAFLPCMDNPVTCGDEWPDSADEWPTYGGGGGGGGWVCEPTNDPGDDEGFDPECGSES